MPQLIMMQIGRGGFPGLRARAHPDGGGDARLSRLRPLAQARAGLTRDAAGPETSRCLLRARGLRFIFLPVVVLVLFSFQGSRFPVPPFTGPSLRWYDAVLGDRSLTAGLLNSITVAVLSSLVAVFLGFLAAYGFARFRLPGAAALRTLVAAPLMVSYLIIGMGLLILFNRTGVAQSPAGRGHRPRRDQPAALLRDHLFADRRPPAERRARRARPRRARLAGARAGADAHALAGPVRELLPGHDLLLGRVRDRVPAHQFDPPCRSRSGAS